MKLIILEIFIFYALNICFGFALRYQNDEHEDSSHDFDSLNLFQKPDEKINTSKSLKLLQVIEYEKFLPASINSVLLDILSESFSNKCVEDFNYVQESFSSLGGWSMEMLDSYGKPGSGILHGNLEWLGKYDECVGVQAPPMENTNVGGFQGRYCSLKLPLKLASVSRSVTIGVCLPDSCNSNKTNFNLVRKYDLNESSLDMGKMLESELRNLTLTCKATSRKLSVGAIAVICLISVITLLVVIGSLLTALEYYMNEKFSTYHKCKQFFNCFCIFTNGEKILNTTNTEGQLPSLYGIRFLSSNWVILFHLNLIQSHYISNSAEAIKNSSRWSLIPNSDLSVDSFFVLSGFLVGYSFFQKAQKNDGKTSWFYFFIHRYVRLTPVYMIVLAFHETISLYLGSGPFWPDDSLDQYCKGRWLWNVLYINNLLPFNSQCMRWSWYLACDMQFYAISPLFLVTLWRWPIVGYALLGLFLCATFAWNFVLTYENYIFGLGQNTKTLYIMDMVYRIPDYLDRIYIKPYTRIGPYLIGLFLAHVVYRRKRNNSSSPTWQTLLVGWIAASIILLVCKFGFYHLDFTTLVASFYNAFNRVGFSLGVGWIIFACVIGKGGFVNNILSWKALIPLSRITYCSYLIHPIIIPVYFQSRKELVFYDNFNQVMLYLGFLVVSYAVALVTSLLFELPVMRLETLLRRN